jgi:hypothetical protein
MSTVKSRAASAHDFTSKVKTDVNDRFNHYYNNPREAALGAYILTHHIVWAPLFHVILAIFFSLAFVCLSIHYDLEYYTSSPGENDKAKLAFIIMLTIASSGALVTSVWWLSLDLRQLPYFEKP